MHDHNKLLYIITFLLNGFLHVTILFTFLFALYYFIISPLTESTLRDLLGSIIDNLYDANVPKMTISLSKLLDVNNSNSNNSNVINSNINNNTVNNDTSNNLNNINNILNIIKNNPNMSSDDAIKLALIKYMYENQYMMNNYLEQNSTTNQLVTINNESVLFFGTVISLSMAVLSVILMIIFKLTLENDLNISEILIENGITFTFVGIIEYWFFTTYAFKYVPMPASLVSSTTIDNIKHLLQTKYSYTNSTNIPPIVRSRVPIVFN